MHKAHRLVAGRKSVVCALVCLYPTKAVPLSQSVQISLRQQPTKEKQGLRQRGFRAQGIASFKKSTGKSGSSITGHAYDATTNR